MKEDDGSQLFNCSMQLTRDQYRQLVQSAQLGITREL